MPAAATNPSPSSAPPALPAAEQPDAPRVSGVTPSPFEETDESLLVRFRSGDPKALARLVRRHESALFNFAFRNVHDRTAAEDIVQEAFVRVVQSASDFNAEARFTTWMYTIVRNLCIDHIRKAAHRRHASLDQTRRGPDGDGPSLGELTRDMRGRSDVERVACGNQAAARIAAAVAALPHDQREVYLMREVSNLRFHEIARVTGVSENTVKSRMRYALERLKQALGDLEDHAREIG